MSADGGASGASPRGGDANAAGAGRPRSSPPPPPPPPSTSDLAALASALQCPICIDVLTDPVTTPCGHAFCAGCVRRAVEARPACPTCGAPVAGASACAPSHALRAVAERLGQTALAAAGGGRGGDAAAGAAAPAPLATSSSTAAAVWAALDGGGAAAGAPSASDLSRADLDALIASLIARRASLAARDAAADLRLLLKFLQRARARQAARLAAATAEVAAVDADLAWVAARVSEADGGRPAALGAAPAQLLLEGGGGGGGGGGDPPPASAALATVDPAALRAGKRRLAAAFDDLQDCYLTLRREREAAGGSGGGGGGGGSGDGGALVPTTTTTTADTAALVPLGPPSTAAEHNRSASPHPPSTAGPGPALAEVSRLLSVCVRAGGRLAHRAQLPPAAGAAPAAGGAASAPTAPPAGSSIISSVEFDAGALHFATAGVARRIAVWRFDDVAPPGDGGREEAAGQGGAADDDAGRAARRVRSGSTGSPPPPTGPSPALSLAADAKLSCVSWCRAPGGPANLLASADYNGGVTLWDAAAGAAVAEYDAHDRRAWSVDFCPVAGGGSAGGGAGATSFATASDDGTARVWCTRSRSAVATLTVGANVCCARFAPAGVPGGAAGAGAELALGSADHSVRVYDLRAAGRGPLATLTGHAQAVSYVRYAPGAPGLVSASTDATLRLWSRAWAGGGGGAPPPPPPRCVRVYRGHANERNFVGLDAAGDLVAAGSETGEVVVYAAALSRPIARAACDGGPAVGAGGLPAPPAFVSAVCWRPAPGDEGTGPAVLPRTLLAATSRGSVHVLELGE